MRTRFTATRAALCLVALGAAFFMSGCAVLDKVVEPAAGLLATGIDKACEHGMTALGIESRKGLVAEINGRTTIGNHTPSDCDNDGLPDFAIDADGMPVSEPVSDLLPVHLDPSAEQAFAELALLSPRQAAPEVAAVEVDHGF